MYFDLEKAREKLHLLKGLEKILLDIDKAIKIIRETEQESEVIPNLMIGFGIDEVQAEYVAEIKLRNINKEYIVKKVAETADLEKTIADLEATLKSKKRINSIIVSQLKAIVKKYDTPRKTGIVYPDELIQAEEEQEQVPDYPVTVFLSREGYLKKITPQSLRMSGEQKYKQGDGSAQSFETSNASEIMFFTDKCQVYKSRLADFEDTKASVLGDYLPGKLGMDEGESVVYMCLPGDYRGSMIFAFENGKVAKVALEAYATKSNRRRLTGAYSDKAPLTAVRMMKEDGELALYSTDGRCLVFSTALLAPKTSRSTQGVAVLSLKKKAQLEKIVSLEETGIENVSRYRVRKIPAAGALLRQEDLPEVQSSLF